MLIRLLKIVLILMVAFLGSLGVFNFLEWGSSYGMVEYVVTMEAAGAPESLQSTTSPVIIALGAIFIGGSKLLGGVFCLAGAISMWRARHAPVETFQAAKRYAILGCGILILLFVGGFLYLADQFFMAYRTELGHDIASGAFYLAGSVAFVMIFVSQRE